MLRFKWLNKLADNPNKSWAHFKLGLGIFSIGAILILLGAQYWVWLQIPGLLFIIVGVVPAAYGYFGILVHRMTSGFKRPPSSFDKDN